MNSIFAIALISIRNAIRSRIVIVLLLFLVVTLIGLPLTVQGDGTLAGHVRLLLRYTLGLATLILSLATVWAACAAISTEIRDRHIQMVLSKPVHAYQLWLGKWLGLTALNGALLLLCVASTYGALRWTTQPDRLTDEEVSELKTEIMVAQRRIDPRPVDLQEEVAREYRSLRAQGQIPEEMSTREVLPQLERTLKRQANAVSPGSYTRWTFDVPHTPPADRPLNLRYRFSLSVLDMETTHGVWTVGKPGTPDRLRIEVADTPRAWHSVTIPPDRICEDGTLTLEYANVHERPITVMFDAEDDLRLMVYEGGFLTNYARAALLLFFHLAFLGAIGITAGAFFSIPVAAVTSFYALLILNAGRFVGRLAEREATIADPQSGWIAQGMAAITQGIYSVLHLVIRPVYAENPLDFVSIGEWIGWGEVGYMFTVKVVFCSGILMLLGVWHMARKEVALPA